MRDAGAGFPVGVAILAFKVVDEGGPDLVHRPDGMFGEGWLVTVLLSHDDDDDDMVWMLLMDTFLDGGLLFGLFEGGVRLERKRWPRPGGEVIQEDFVVPGPRGGVRRKEPTGGQTACAYYYCHVKDCTLGSRVISTCQIYSRGLYYAAMLSHLSLSREITRYRCTHDSYRWFGTACQR